MSKYWCKPCKTFVLDTKLGKSQHEASSRHKASLTRNLRDLHRQKSQAQRDDASAKRMLENIEKMVGSKSASLQHTRSSILEVASSTPASSTSITGTYSKSTAEKVNTTKITTRSLPMNGLGRVTKAVNGQGKSKSIDPESIKEVKNSHTSRPLTSSKPFASFSFKKNSSR
ncbi:hypothetical protein V1514DRAFT_331712 [Lipomyces japonicus]|uniref:uncharacterized protein n=1 Tax=Lipomyces japonicus TaxID=56871 RepID=UPI0034D01114